MENKKLKVIFAGMPDMAMVCLPNILQAGFDVVGVVPPEKTHATYGYFNEYVQSKKLNMIDFDKSPNEKECIEKISALKADIGVICSYNKLFSKEFLKTTKMGYINSHPSLLPNYRGAAPYFHVVNNGEKISGITLHFADETFDTGDIVYQKQFEVLPFETMGTIFNRTNYMISDSLIEILTKLQNGEELERKVQDKENSFIEAPRVGGNFRIRWKTNSVFEIERLIRASNPFYNAFTFFRGVNLKVIKASVFEKEHNLKYGEIALASDKNLLIAAKGGFLSLDVVQVSTWGVFEKRDFYYTFTPEVGEILE